MKAKVMLGMFMTAAVALPTWAADWTVGANVGNVPWEFQDKKGDIVGFEVDVVKEVAKRAGKTVEFINIPFNGLFSAVQSNRVDIAISSITITPKRLESVAFAQPYYDSDQSLTALSTSKVKSLDDMNGKVVGVDTGSTGDMWVGTHKGEYKFADVSRYEGLSPAMLDLASGRIDGYISDIPALQYYIKDKPQYSVVARIPTGERYSLMHAKGWAMADEVNDIISKMKEDGTMGKFHQQWFGAEADKDSSTVKVTAVLK
ncbi:ABC transporter substrate-binding protein [Pseudomonas marincola]|uniref:ABC transporter substrate-binding protein n=1 Tax=Pseudomonas marincola TaxID=437900 RepID=A0A653E5B5_9PSED|nr:MULTISPECIES: transporter substrate-binding domain-containing protein [Pseudomonas]NRH28433.1 transporter substrate-binding domain-containing protein [Pseudomonas sp. MS19]OEO24847.1 ABC transporter substrate-binding protein [Pseudomonas sp. J237]CAE6901687.1 ABC transporter substrate-binding protein [Pseudomonas marincola]